VKLNEIKQVPHTNLIQLKAIIEAVIEKSLNYKQEARVNGVRVAPRVNGGEYVYDIGVRLFWTNGTLNGTPGIGHIEIEEVLTLLNPAKIRRLLNKKLRNTYNAEVISLTIKASQHNTNTAIFDIKVKSL